VNKTSQILNLQKLIKQVAVKTKIINNNNNWTNKGNNNSSAS